MNASSVMGSLLPASSRMVSAMRWTAICLHECRADGVGFSRNSIMGIS
jgi:hypothetical protein